MSVCTTLAKPDSVCHTPKPLNSVEYRFFRSVEEAGSDWDEAAPQDDIFLQRHYLSVIERYPPTGTTLGFIVFYKQGRPAGVALCQFKYFNVSDNIQELNSSDNRKVGFFDKLVHWFKKRVAGIASTHIMICGNVLLSGQHGWYLNSALFNQKEAVEIVEEALYGALVTVAEAEGISIPVMLIKDVTPEWTITRRRLVEIGFIEFDVQPSMVLDLPFGSFEEYLGAMSTKYRTRTKRAFKKFEGIERRELTLDEIIQELPVIFRLYRDVAKNAGFNMVDLTPDYFVGMKAEFGEYFRLYGYFREGKMVAFYSTIQNHKELEAHFIGYEKSLNHEYQLYLNMLYDFIRLGIDSRSSSVIFARTALEIKSSVGAVPRPLWNYVRHQNNFANRFTGTILECLKPVEIWQQRHPFRESIEDLSE